jgi:hypothetical protein
MMILPFLSGHFDFGSWPWDFLLLGPYWVKYLWATPVDMVIVILTSFLVFQTSVRLCEPALSSSCEFRDGKVSSFRKVQRSIIYFDVY